MNELLLSLIDRLDEVKASELDVKHDRSLIEEQIIALVGNDKEEGSKTVSGDSFSVSVTNGLNRSVDFSAIEAINNDLKKSDLGIIDLKPSLNLKNLRLVEKVANAETMKTINAAITVTAKKPSLSIKRK